MMYTKKCRSKALVKSKEKKLMIRKWKIKNKTNLSNIVSQLHFNLKNKENGITK